VIWKHAQVDHFPIMVQKAVGIPVSRVRDACYVASVVDAKSFSATGGGSECTETNDISVFENDGLNRALAIVCGPRHLAGVVNSKGNARRATGQESKNAQKMVLIQEGMGSP
jgi:hypothetical protein